MTRNFQSVRSRTVTVQGNLQELVRGADRVNQRGPSRDAIHFGVQANWISLLIFSGASRHASICNYLVAPNVF